jgi:hypothetical protein
VKRRGSRPDGLVGHTRVDSDDLLERAEDLPARLGLGPLESVGELGSVGLENRRVVDRERVQRARRSHPL